MTFWFVNWWALSTECARQLQLRMGFQCLFYFEPISIRVVPRTADFLHPQHLKCRCNTHFPFWNWTWRKVTCESQNVILKELIYGVIDILPPPPTSPKWNFSISRTTSFFVRTSNNLTYFLPFVLCAEERDAWLIILCYLLSAKINRNMRFINFWVSGTLLFHITHWKNYVIRHNQINITSISVLYLWVQANHSAANKSPVPINMASISCIFILTISLFSPESTKIKVGNPNQWDKLKFYF